MTTTNGLIEDQTSVALSADKKTLYYCTNACDIERRHIWAVPVAGGTPRQVDRGRGIETMPAPLASGKMLATLSADWKMPQSVGLWSLEVAGVQSSSAYAFPTSLKGISRRRARRAAAHADEGAGRTRDPQPALPAEGSQTGREASGDGLRSRRTGAADAARLSLHAVLSLGVRHQPMAREPGLRRDVGELSQRDRLRPFVPHRAEHRRRGNAEYQDVLAGGKYLQTRPDVDPAASASGACRTAAC